MHIRPGALAAAVVLAVSLAACQSTGSDGSSGGSGGSSGGSSGGAAGGSNSNGVNPVGDLDGAGAKEALTTGDQRGSSGEDAHRFQVGGCRLWFGVSWDRSDQYLVSADRYGVGGHTQWSCSGVNIGVDDWHLKTWVEWTLAPGAGAVWSKEGELQIDTAGHQGVRFPTSSDCTSDYWRVTAQVYGTMTDGTAIPKQTISSQWRKVTSEDCARE